jgi:hypothetical protein
VLVALVLAMSDFLNPGDGPDPSGEFRVSPTFLIVLLLLGFVIGTVGHIIKSRTLQIAGVLLIFAATIFLPLAYSISN